MKGRITKSESKLINVWIPENLIPCLDQGVRKEDSDRSKFIRTAIREKLSRHGILITPEK